MHVRIHRLLATAAAGVLLAVGSVGTANADDVVNDLDSTVPRMDLVVGGEGTTTIYVVPTGRPEDTLQGCNIRGNSSYLEVRATSSDTAVATVSLTDSRIDGCDQANGVPLHVSAMAAGGTVVTLSMVSTNANGTFNFAPATFKVDVSAPAANTPPRIHVAGADDGDVYQLGGYSPNLTCFVEDAEDGGGAPFFRIDPVVIDERDDLGLGRVFASCSYTDTGGLTAYDEVTFTVVDTIAPTMQRLSLTPEPNPAGWNDTPVTATWGCFDAGSDVMALEVSATTEGQGANLSLEGTCRDHAGNTTSDTVDGINVDLTDPVIGITRTPAANTAGWNDGDVTVAWTCTDALSGPTDPGGSAVLGEGEGQSAGGTCTDLAGNSASAEVRDVNVDRTAPLITLASRTEPYDSQGWNGGDVTVTWTCSDTGSGPAESSVTRVVDTAGVDQSVTGTCVDLAGNTASDTVGGINIDTTDPTIDLSRDPEPNTHGWHGSAVEVSWGCDDTGGSGLVAAGGSTTVGEGENQSVVRHCTDHAGNTVEGAMTDIDVDLTRPVIDISRTPPPATAAGWNNEAVRVTWTCRDALSGVEVTEDSAVLGEGEDQFVTGTCVDLAGNASTAEVTDIDVDLTAPVIDIQRSPAANSSGWNAGDVTVSWTCTDELSGVVDKGGATVLGEGKDQSAGGTCTDLAGNTARGEVTGVNVDRTAPTIHIGRTPASNEDGWNNSDVRVAWTCEDTLSGPTDPGGTTVLDGEGTGQGVTGTCTDLAGNTARGEVTGVNIDRTAPTVAWIEPIGDGAQLYVGSVPPVPGCAATDALSGLLGSCSVSGYSNKVGVHTLTATAVDKAGNSRAITTTYEVKPWGTLGYYRPVDMGGVWNTVKNGSTVPLKFEVFAGTTEITSTNAVGATFAVTSVTCNGATADDIEMTTTGGTSFRYDTTAGQFIQNWQTPKKAGACYEVVTTLADGSSISARFLLK